MKNKFLTRGLFAGAVLTGWLVFTSLSGSALAVDVVGGGAAKTAGEDSGTYDINGADTDPITTSGTGVATIDMQQTMTNPAGTVDVSEGVVLTVDDVDGDNDYEFKAGAATFTGTSGFTTTNNVGAAVLDSVATGTATTITAGDAGITVTNATTLEAGEVLNLAGVGDVTLTGGLDLAAGADAENVTAVNLTNTGTVALGAITLAGDNIALTSSADGSTVSATSVALGAGTFDVAQSGTGSLGLGAVTVGSDVAGSVLKTSGTVGVTSFDVDNCTTLTSNGTLTVSGGTDIAADKGITLNGTGITDFDGGVTLNSSGSGETLQTSALMINSGTTKGAITVASDNVGAIIIGESGTLGATDTDITTTLTDAATLNVTNNNTSSAANIGVLTAGDGSTLYNAGAGKVSVKSVSIGDTTALNAIQAGTGELDLGTVTAGGSGSATVNVGGTGTGAMTAASLDLSAQDMKLVLERNIKATAATLDNTTLTVDEGATAQAADSGYAANIGTLTIGGNGIYDNQVAVDADELAKLMDARSVSSLVNEASVSSVPSVSIIDTLEIGTTAGVITNGDNTINSAVGIATANIDDNETLTLSGTFSDAAYAAGTSPVSTNTVGIETLNLKGGSNSSTVNVVDAAVGVRNVVVGQGKTGTIKFTTGGVLEADNVSVGKDATLKVASAGADELELKNITLSGGTLDATTAGANKVYTSSITTTSDISYITGAGTNDEIIFHNTTVAATDENYVTPTFSLAKTLIYDGANVTFYEYKKQDDGSYLKTAIDMSQYNTVDSSAGPQAVTYTDSAATLTQGTVTNAALAFDGSGKTATVATGKTVVATDEVTVAASDKLAVAAGGAYVQNTGALVGNGTVELGGELMLGADSTLADLDVTSASAKLTGAGVATVTDLDIAAGNTLNVNSALTTGGADADLGTGTLELGNTASNAGSTLTLGADTSVGTLAVTSGERATIAGGNKLTTTNGANIAGHLNLKSDLTVQGGAFNISANTLAMGDGTTTTVGDAAWINETANGQNSHVTVGAFDANDQIDNTLANVEATLDNQSNMSNNKLSKLDIAAGDGNAGSGLAGTELHVTNRGTGDSQLTIGTTTLTANANTDDAIISVETAMTADKTNTVTLETVNLVGNAVGAADSFNNGNSSVWLWDDDGATPHNGKVDLTINNLNVGTAILANKFGAVYNSVDGADDGLITIKVATVDNSGTLELASDVEDKLVVEKLYLDGTLTNDFTNATANHAKVDYLKVAAGDTSTITHVAGLKVGEMDVYGDLTLTNAWTTLANDKIAVRVGGIVRGNVTTVADSGVGVDLGSGIGTNGINNVTTTYGSVIGQITTADADNTGTTVSQVYAVNGVSGITYNDVFSTAIQAADTSTFGNGKTLSTMDTLRIYTLADSGKDIVVSTNTSGINSVVTENGGSAEDASFIAEMIEKQGSMNAQDAAYVTALSQLQGAQLTRAGQQSRGEEATTGTAQAAIQGVIGSASAVSNQMTSFRSGSISAGMTSFSTGGATAALSDMADADTLADAYEAGFTGASDQGVYHKVQVWANGYGGFGEQGTDGNMIGYDFWNIGTMVGLDYAFAKELRVGALFGYSYNETDVNWDSGDSHDNALRFGAYASYNWDNFFVDLSPTMGVHIIDSNRNIWNGATAKGERTGVDFNINGTIGYTFNLPCDFQITPSYSLGYTMFYDPDYTETGAGSANVSYDSFTSNSLVQDLGVRFGKLFRASDDLAFLPEAWGGWEVEYLNTGGTRNTTGVANISSQTSMNGMATHRGYWGAGMTALIKDNISVYGRYDHKIWDKGYNVGFTAGVKVSF